MNESFALHGAGSLNMEASRLGSIAQRWDAAVLVGDGAFYRNNAALGVLLGGLCLGLLGLLLFMIALCYKKINTQHFTVFKVSLVISGLLQSLSTSVVAMQFFGNICSLRYCERLLVVWFASIRCGMLLHLLVTLEFILTWRQSHDGAKFTPLHWSVPVVLTLDLICVLFSDVIEASVALGAMATTLTLNLCFSVYYNRRSLDRRLTQVFWTALLSFGVTYCPIFVAECMSFQGEFISGRVYDILLCLTNLRLVADGYLCWVTCRETEEEAPQQVEAGEVEPPYAVVI